MECERGKEIPVSGSKMAGQGGAVTAIKGYKDPEGKSNNVNGPYRTASCDG